MADLTQMNGGVPFDTHSLPPTEDFAPLPAGWYTGFVEAEKLKETKAKTGWYLNLTVNVMQPEEFAGRKIFHNITLVNQNEKAVEIGKRELCGLGQAIGLLAVPDSSEILNKMLDFKLKVTAAKDGYDAGNEIRAFRACEGQTTPVAQQAPAPTQQIPVYQQPVQQPVQQPAQQPVQQPPVTNLPIWAQ